MRKKRMSYINDFRPELSSETYSFTRDIFDDEVTFQKVHKHLTDEHDMITDDDLENIKTVINNSQKINETPFSA